MEPSQLLIEYLKEQYAQARQHETRQTAVTTFLTAANGAIIALTLKDGHLLKAQWWLGLVIIGLGLANWAIIAAHHTGNRFHTKLAGKVRHRLENLCDWQGGPNTSDLRNVALSEMGLKGPNISIGGLVYNRLKIIPLFMVVVGAGLVILAWCFGLAPP